MAKEMTKEQFVKYVKNLYSLDEINEDITFDRLGEILQYYLKTYKDEFFKNNFECVLLHKYYKDFLEEVMPVIENVNTLYENGPSNFNIDLYQKATLANKLNKQIIERVLITLDDCVYNTRAYEELINLANIKDNNIFKKDLPYEEKRAAHDLPHLDYSKAHTDPIKVYFISRENVLKKELLKTCPESDIADLEDLLNLIYEYSRCKENSETKAKTL